jgi:hypothetical protein
LKTRACREERLAFLAAVVCLSPPPRGPLTPTSSDDYLHSQEFEKRGGAEISIKDHNGKELLEAVANGPLLFAKLPAGRYEVQATAMGRASHAR